MRISINAGLDSGIPSITNSNSFVLDSASIIPNSMVQLEDVNKGVADNSATPAVLSELAQVDLDLNNKPSMMETDSTSIVKFFSDLFSKSVKPKFNADDFEGTYTVRAFGKFADEPRLLEFLKTVSPSKPYELFKSTVSFFKECYSEHSLNDLNTIEMIRDEKEYVEFRNSMKLKNFSKCKKIYSGPNISPADIKVISTALIKSTRYSPHLCGGICYQDGLEHLQNLPYYKDPRNKAPLSVQDVENTYQGICRSLNNYKFSHKRYSKLTDKLDKGSLQGLDAEVGYLVLGIYDQLMNYTLCEMKTKVGCGPIVEKAYKEGTGDESIHIREYLVKKIEPREACKIFEYEN